MKALSVGVAGMGLSLLGATAHAQTSGPFTFTLAQATTDFTNSTITLPKFDPTLGTLTEVDLSESLNGVFNGTVTNTSAGAANFRVTEDVNLVLSTGATPLLTPGGVDLLATQTYTGLAAGASSPFGPFTPTVADSAVYTSGSLFNAFVGPGNIGFTLSTLTGTTTLGGGGNITNAINTTAGGTVTVLYRFQTSSVPEPGTFAMLVGMGISGSAFLIRRKRRA